jgi:predicted nucleic acid-binding protein
VALERTSTLIDSNVLIDVLGPVGANREWSAAALTFCRGTGPLIVNQIIWSELAPLASGEDMLLELCDQIGIDHEAIPWSAAFEAGRAHLRYRRAGGSRERTLPDFLIGAHASVGGHRILTRDTVPFRAHFPDVELVAPDTHP